MASVPSDDFPDALTALARLIAGKRSIHVATAFVTRSGVDLLEGLLQGRAVIELTVVARGAPITDPAALQELRDRLGATVSVMAGPTAPAFHPKLWHLEGDDGLHVLSGSGNLTGGGLQTNREQFELLHLTESSAIESEKERFSRLTADSVALDRFEGSIAWRAWMEQRSERERLLHRLDELERRLAESNPVNRGPDTALLMRDLWDVYHRTLAERLPKENGDAYNPSGFRLQLEGKRGSTEPVPIAASICKSGTEGFDTILRSDRPELTVEYLVVDETKDYHDLFPEETVRLSAERLEQFPSWNRADTPSEDLGA